MTEIEIIAGAQQLERFAYSQTPLTVSEITKRLNELVNPLKRVTDINMRWRYNETVSQVD